VRANFHLQHFLVKSGVYSVCTKANQLKVCYSTMHYCAFRMKLILNLDADMKIRVAGHRSLTKEEPTKPVE
jgi:hypothetical protein